MTRTVAPAVSPVSLAEAKAHLRVGHADEDALISAMIDAAVGHMDGWRGILGRCLITQTWAQTRPEDTDFVPPFPDMGEVTEETADGIVTATFTAGFGPTAADVPAALRSAILLHVGSLFRDREREAAGSPRYATRAYEDLVMPYRQVGQ